jgi:integrase/recombinase XerD
LTPSASRWLTVHQLRHTGGTARTDHGQRLGIVQRVVGHTEPRSTQLYADVTEDDVRWTLETRR